MPRNGTGTYTLPRSPFTPGTVISSADVNADFSDIATALTGSVAANGETSLTNQLRGVVGTSPAWSFAADTNTGLGSDTTDEVYIKAGGVESFNVTSTGVAVTGIGVGGGFNPIGAVVDYAGSSAPSGWLLCFGQAISRTTYVSLFNVIGTTYGVGDGSTTFNLPDGRGRVVAGKDDMGGPSANRLTGLTDGVDGDVLGGVGGLETNTLTTAQLASHTHTVNVTDTHQHYSFVNENNVTGSPSLSASTYPPRAMSISTTFDYGIPGTATVANIGLTSGTTVGSITAAAVAAGSGSAHNNVQPTIIFNKIIFVGV